MREYLAARARSSANPVHGRNLAREYLQVRVLESLQRAGAMVPLAFHGGTALRFLYSLPRFSEDLDFALERPTLTYDFLSYLQAVELDLRAEGYAIEVRARTRRIVHGGFLRFPGLLYELGISRQRGEVLAIKIEVDTNPPDGADLATSIVSKHVLLRVQHHGPSSLFAGKLHAILQRPYLKGRDIYDLVWYLGNRAWPEPNLIMLNNALTQTGWTGSTLTEENWRAVLRQRLVALDWHGVAGDVAPFVEAGAGAEVLTRENVLGLILP